MKFNISEISEVIKERRTIKPEDFTARVVHKEIVESILDNAKWAPTHALTQPWYFKVFIGKGVSSLADFQSETYKRITPEHQFSQSKFDKLKNRPSCSSVIIAICMKRQASEKIPEIEELAAVACAVQNIHLTATAYGLGGYWGSGGLSYSDEMKEFLGLGSKDKCLGFFYMGYPAIEWPRGQRRPLEYYTDWVEN